MAETGIKKLYYSISEVSALLALEPHVLRYWETEFDQLKPRKSKGGRRTYTEADIAMALRIKTLLREDKYTIEGARQVLNRPIGEFDEAQFREDLHTMRGMLADLLTRL